MTDATAELERLGRRALTVGIAATVLSLLLGLGDRSQFLRV